MRIGIVLRAPWGDDAARAEELGLDLGWVDADAPLVVAAGVAARTTGVRIAAALEAGPNPVAIAEEAAVADLALGGRLVLVLRSADDELLRESVELLFHSFAARPFEHAGPRFRTPARLPEHEHAEQRVLVTPPPAQLEPVIWLAGPAGARVAEAAGLGYVADGDVPAPRPGLAAQRVRRPALVDVAADADGTLDVPTVVDDLRAAQAAWGMDVAIVRLPSLDAPARGRAVRSIAMKVRPRVQLDRLPSGLEEHWAARV